MMLPLEGLIVVSVEQAVAAPFCSSRLADAGAHVVKIERPEGDFAGGYDAAAKGQSSYFVWLNRGKNSVVIDLATKEGRRYPDLDVRRDGRLDGGAADQFGSRQSAEADGAGPSLDRALRRVQFKGRQGHFDLDPERARMEEALRRGAGSARPAQRCQI